MVSRIPSSEVVRQFDQLIDRVRDGGEEFVVERGGQAVCRISPLPGKSATVGDVARLLKSLPPPDEGYLDAVEEQIRRHNVPSVPEDPWAH